MQVELVFSDILFYVSAGQSSLNAINGLPIIVRDLKFTLQMRIGEWTI